MKNLFILQSLFFLLLIFLTSHLPAQVSEEKIELSNKTIRPLFLKDGSFLLKTRSNKTIQLKRFTSQGKLQWTVETKNQYGLKPITFSGTGDLAYNLDAGLLSLSQSGKTIFIVQIKDDGEGRGDYYNTTHREHNDRLIYGRGLGGDNKAFNNKTHYITKISETGEVKEFEIEGKDEFGKQLQTIFSDDQYLYYLVTQEDKDNKKKDLFILNRFDINTMAHQKSILDLPFDNETPVLWSYQGQLGQEKILSGKIINPKQSKNTIQIVTFNSEGKTLRNFKLDFDLESKFSGSAWDVRNFTTPYKRVNNVDAHLSPFRSTGNDHNKIQPTEGAFCSVFLDEKNNNIYLYGCYGNNPEGIISSFTGFFLFKFDTNGNLIWKSQYPAEMKGAGTYYEREMNFKVLPNQELNFSYVFRGHFSGFFISQEGKLIRNYQKEDFNGFADLAQYSNSKSKSLEYVNKLSLDKKNKETVWINNLTETDEILLEWNYKAELFKILYFK